MAETQHKKTARGALLLAAVLLVSLLGGCGAATGSSSGGTAASPAPTGASQPAVTATAQPAATGDEYRAAWITYLEYQTMDLSTEEAFRSGIATAFDNLQAMGITTVIAHVRPFGDALYASSIFPWSHLLTGTQGQDPGYDPLAVMVQQAHSRGMRLEAMVNPYRVRGSATTPPQLAPQNPAAQYQADPAKADWVIAVGDGLYYNPGIPEVQQLIVDGVREICENYEVDGIQFDDYFYPEGADDSFDAAAYAQYANGQPLAAWRRQNVNTLVQQVYAAIKAARPAATFGISPQGNNDNNYNTQYSDVALWMSDGGYVDYVMPQIYWGFDYRTKSGRDDYAFANNLQYWLSLPRADAVKLYIGLGAYRIGVGDGGSNDTAEWSSGENLAKQVAALRSAGADGYALYSYRWLFANTQPTAAAEVAALTVANQ